MPAMHRTHRLSNRLSLVVASALVALVAMLPFGTSASAQDSANQLEQLNSRKRDLDNKVAAEDKTIGDADSTIASLGREVQKSAVKIEITADAYARIVDARREPARTRVAFAIDAYVRGDPLLTSIIEELLNLTSRADDLYQRELYRAVVRDAETRLAAIDQQLRDIATKVAAQQAASKAVNDQLAAAREKKRVATENRQKFAAERADALRQIEDITARATRAVLTGMSSFEDQNRPALIIKIDNVDEARPQDGINRADVVFEEQVEGGLTRLAAVFHSRGSDPVGPIRSVRTSDVHLFANLNKPLFASSGGNAGTRAQLLGSSLVDVGPTEYPDIYYRENRTPRRRHRSARCRHQLRRDQGRLRVEWQRLGARPEQPQARRWRRCTGHAHERHRAVHRIRSFSGRRELARGDRQRERRRLDLHQRLRRAWHMDPQERRSGHVVHRRTGQRDRVDAGQHLGRAAAPG